MTEQHSIFDYSFKEDELKPRRLDVLHLWFKVYLVVISFLSIVFSITGVDELIGIMNGSITNYTPYAIQMGVSDLLMTLMNLAGAAFIFLEYKKGVLVFIIITILKLSVYSFFAITIAIKTFAIVGLAFWPVLLHIPALVYLISRRVEWENALKKSAIRNPDL